MSHIFTKSKERWEIRKKSPSRCNRSGLWYFWSLGSSKSITNQFGYRRLSQLSQVVRLSYVVVCCPVFLSAGLSFDGFAFGRQIQSANQSKSKTNFPKFPDTAPIWSICRLAHLPLFFLPSDDPFWWPWRAYIREVQEDCLWTLQDPNPKLEPSRIIVYKSHID